MFPLASKPSLTTEDDDLAAMRRRVEALKTGTTEEWILAQGHRKPYPVAPVIIPRSSEIQVMTSVAEVQPHRIIPTPISRAQKPPSNATMGKSSEEI